MSDFGTDFAQATQAADEVFGDPVTYERGASSKSVTAVRAQPLFPSDGNEVRLDQVRRDYQILAADLVSLLGSPPEPAKGDRITDGTAVYEILAPPGGQAFEDADPDGIWLLVHCKRVSA